MIGYLHKSASKFNSYNNMISGSFLEWYGNEKGKWSIPTKAPNWYEKES